MTLLLIILAVIVGAGFLLTVALFFFNLGRSVGYEEALTADESMLVPGGQIIWCSNCGTEWERG